MLLSVQSFPSRCSQILPQWHNTKPFHDLQPGSLQSWPKPAAGTETGIDASKAKTMEDFILHIFPDSFFKALAENEILQIVIFSLFFGVALGSIGEVGKRLIHVIENLAEVIFKMVNYVMEVAPYAVFAAMTTVVANKGLSILISYGYLMICFMGGLLFFTVVILWIISLPMSFTINIM